jgi:glutamyl-tRNA synthetase
MSAVRGRLAPSPTGLMHLGNARTALVAWLSVRAAGGALVWRVEDIDSARSVAGLAEAAEKDLAWLGLDWDESPSLGGPYAPYVQSKRLERYERALDRLLLAERLFPCGLSRKDLEGIASAPHTRDAALAYPASLRPSTPAADWLETLRSGGGDAAAVRFLVSDTAIRFEDRLCGTVEENVVATTGDFVVRRRDGVFAYQLAVVVDDLEMAVTEVVRGSDLLDSTARQIQLIEALGGTRPAYAHIPLVNSASGVKLSKRDEALTLHALREHGIAAPQILGYLAWSIGLLDRPMACSPSDLVALFSWDALSREALSLPPDLIGYLSAV